MEQSIEDEFLKDPIVRNNSGIRSQVELNPVRTVDFS